MYISMCFDHSVFISLLCFICQSTVDSVRISKMKVSWICNGIHKINSYLSVLLYFNSIVFVCQFFIKPSMTTEHSVGSMNIVGTSFVMCVLFIVSFTCVLDIILWNIIYIFTYRFPQQLYFFIESTKITQHQMSFDLYMLLHLCFKNNRS